MKTLSKILKALTCAFAAATILMFFFKFVTVAVSNTNIDYTGFEMAFGSVQSIGGKDINTYKSMWYFVAFLLSAFTLVFSGAGFKFKGSQYASVVTGIATTINLGVIYFVGSITKYFDVRPVDGLGITSINKELFFLLAFVIAAATVVISVISLLVADYVEVKESNGAKLTIPQRIVRFFKDYKSDLKRR